MKTTFKITIKCLATIGRILLWIAVPQAENIPRLANRSETMSLQVPKGIINTQHLAVDSDVLKALALNRIERVIIPVFYDDVIFHKKFQQIRAKSATWRGEDETGTTSILLTIGNGHFFATVISNNKTVFFKPAGIDNRVVSYQVDKAFEVPLVDDDVFPIADSPAQAGAAQAAPAQSADDNSRIDVMVLYTSGMAADHPGSEIDTHIQSLIDRANLILSNSNINTQLNLVHSEEVIYPDDSPGDMNQALEDLTDNNGAFANVEALRTEFGADQVTLLRRFVDEGCGFAWLVKNDNARLAYALVHDGFKTDGSGYYCSDVIYAHEVGHNLGCAHDRANSSVGGIFPYSYGYQSPAGIFRTLMSYDCPGGCLRLDYFSNPDIWYNGEPIGIAAPHPDSADNARTVDQTRITVAGFREEVQPFITVTSPDGETVWRRGRTYRIMWISSNLSGNVKVELFQGGILDTTINPGTPDTGSISYTVPFSQPLGSNYRIRVTSVESSDIFDESDGEFTIAEAPEIKAIPWIQLLLLED